MPERLYKHGDIIPNIGMVQSNHCGLPWPVTVKGDQYCGTIHVRLSHYDKKHPTGEVHCDAKTGNILTDAEFAERKNNMDYNYNQLFRA
jgi:hypothetical protein